jgi:integrase
MPHIYQLPSKHWRAIVKHGGITRSVTGRTKGEAQRLAAETLISMGGTPRYSPTVGELLDGHLAAATLSPTTLADYRSVAGRLPVPFLGRRTDQVTPGIVEALYAELTADGLSGHRIGRVHDLLSGAWQRAIRLEWAERNPVRAVSKPRTSTHEIMPPTPEQVASLIAHAPDETFAVYLRLAASTGARRGELAGLQWGDIDFDRGHISIRRSLAYTKSSGTVMRDTKTGSKGFRRIAVGLDVQAALRRLRTDQATMALAAGLTPLWVFSGTAGATHHHPSWATQAFAAARVAAGIGDVRLHDLRHFVATRMLASGHSVAQVSARLGQTQAATTHRYSHWIPSVDREAAEALEALLR